MMGKEERRVAGNRAVPLTFAPAGEPAPARGVQRQRDGRGYGDAMAPVLPRGNARSDESTLPRLRLRQVFGLVDVALAPTVRRFPGIGPVRVAEFVSTYRCGAAPAWYRLPISFHLCIRIER